MDNNNRLAILIDADNAQPSIIDGLMLGFRRPKLRL